MDDPQTIGRVTRSKQQAQAMYDRIGGWYDVLEGVWEKAPRAVGLAKLAVEPGETALEIGVGPGHDLVTLAQAVGETGRVYGFDLSPRMLGLARARVASETLSRRVQFQRGDAVRLSLQADCIDAIFMSFTLELFDTPEISQVLAECRRVLHDDGRLAVVSLSEAGESTWMRKLYVWGHERLPLFLDCRPIFVQRALDAAGFYNLDVTEMLMWGLPVEVVLARKQLQ